MDYGQTKPARSGPERLRAVCGRIKNLIEAEGTPALAFLDTYGCQQNEADSDILRGLIGEMGYSFTDDENKADLIVINTCAVREHAQMRILGNVGALTHAKKQNPRLIVALCGCMVRQEHMIEKVKRSYRVVDIVFGMHEMSKFPELLEQFLLTGKRIFARSPEEGEIEENLPVLREGKIKARIPVMYGCNNFCSYCVVPFVRGRERSRDAALITDEARSLVENGCKDIMLLGQNVNSYGLDRGAGTDFSDLIAGINEIPGEFLIRFMTSHPKDATEKLFSVMAASEKCARHIHLPVQSGNDRVLRAMNRGYTGEEYADLAEKARRLMPDLVLTTDVIVGFPGETDREFEDTLELVKKVEFDAMFTFIFSKREGTPAACMDDPVTRSEKQARFDRLLEVQNVISEKKHAACIGKTVKVLIDGETKNSEYNLSSRTNGGRLVHLRGNLAPGGFVNAEITGAATWALFGEVSRR
ncbi:MAG: tRNA (N6-isopentenyl adenosine(37)-C2)-methylthiotransferase MiaB [Oscillospiraceae bacterium]|nr:tRNA (N6-isopentenyl adenosine(37)-C2)-methylthiotransferase MiaB [Oscillospiraceae bacterium]